MFVGGGSKGLLALRALFLVQQRAINWHSIKSIAPIIGFVNLQLHQSMINDDDGGGDCRREFTDWSLNLKWEL